MWYRSLFHLPPQGGTRGNPSPGTPGFLMISKEESGALSKMAEVVGRGGKGRRHPASTDTSGKDPWAHRPRPAPLGPVSLCHIHGWASSAALWAALALSQRPGEDGEPAAGNPVPFPTQPDEESRTQISGSKPHTYTWGPSLSPREAPGAPTLPCLVTHPFLRLLSLKCPQIQHLTGL